MAGVILAGDIGGTKTHLGLYRAAPGGLAPMRERIFHTSEFAGLEQACATFLVVGERPDAACFGVPGPVIDGVSHATNVPWSMASDAIASALGGVQTRLMNDLEATAYGIAHLGPADLETLQAGEKRAARANLAVIAAGTGLGEAALIAAPGGDLAVASEGGHCDFAPRGDEQRALLDFLGNEFGHVSFERVLSGPGLHNIYRFLAASAPRAEPAWLTARMATEDPSAVIGECAIDGRDSLCGRALELFTMIYAAEAANLALKYLALGGVYLCGGIAPKILPFLRRREFVEGFLDKGRLRTTLERIGIHVSLNPSAALLGAAWAGAAML
jgi:glucokinase